MQKVDGQLFAGQLNALAETFDRKPVTSKAMEVWFDALKEFPTESVMDVLNSWAKRHPKFPVPAEVWKEVNELHIKRREETTKFERSQNSGPIVWEKSPEADACKARIRAIFKRPRKTRDEYWRWVLSEAPKGSLAERSAREVLKLDKVEREPGQDDEEKAVNF